MENYSGKMVRLSIQSQNKKSCVDVRENVLDQNLLKYTNYEGKFPNWDGQVKRIYGHAWRWGCIIANLHIENYEKFSIDELSNKYEILSINYPFIVDSKNGEHLEMGDCWDGGCWDFLEYVNVNDEEEIEDENLIAELEEQFQQLCNDDDNDVYHYDGEFNDFYLIGPFEISDVEHCDEVLIPDFQVSISSSGI